MQAALAFWFSGEVLARVAVELSERVQVNLIGAWQVRVLQACKRRSSGGQDVAYDVMLSVMKKIPCNLVMGFLGVGKTTAIQALLAQRPAGARWAVLVNEFGQIGIDAALLAAPGVAVKEVPGGCLCCVNSVPFSVGLTRLIREQQSHRILIEPSGIGHPHQVIQQLTSATFAEHLDLRASITLVDARKLSDARYLRHPIFQDQISMADVLVGNKYDTYSEADRERFMAYARQCQPPKQQVMLLAQGQIPVSLLDLNRLAYSAQLPDEHAHAHAHTEYADQRVPLANSPDTADWFCVEGAAHGFQSIGWQIAAAIRFRLDCLQTLIDRMSGARIKGLVHTDWGWQQINNADGHCQTQTAEPGQDSRLEIITAAEEGGHPFLGLDQRLRACRWQDAM